MNYIALLGTVSVLGLGVVWLLRRLLAPQAVSECDPEWLDEFSIEKYRPMLRLLADDDYDFLAMQAGQTMSTIRQLRRERRRIFRAYLRSLTSDFQRLHLAGRMLLVYSKEERPELAQKLVEQRIHFTLTILNVHFRLVLHTLGIGKVEVRGLLGSLDALRMEVAASQPGLA